MLTLATNGVLGDHAPERQMRFHFGRGIRVRTSKTEYLVPIHKRHGVPGPGFRPITRHIIDLVVLQPRLIHSRNHRIPVLDLGRSDLEQTLRDILQSLFVARFIASESCDRVLRRSRNASSPPDAITATRPYPSKLLIARCSARPSRGTAGSSARYAESEHSR